MIRTTDRLIDAARRSLHLTPRAYLRPSQKRSGESWFAGLREREQNKIEIERQKVSVIEASIEARRKAQAQP